MGLDMYLRKQQRTMVNELEVRNIETVHQWRKANAIHGYIESYLNVSIENCIEYEIPSQLLTDLLTTIDKVLHEQHLAPSLLPTTQGFFYGSSIYDSYYFEELTNTKNTLTTLLNSYDKTTEQFFYYAWW